MTEPDDDIQFETLTELREVSCGALSVVVDFCELMNEQGEEQAMELIGKLKDLLA